MDSAGEQRRGAAGVHLKHCLLNLRHTSIVRLYILNDVSNSFKSHGYGLVICKLSFH